MTEGGKPGRCGWLEERFRFVWRAVPEELPAILNGPDPEGRKQITDTMMAMSRIDLAAIQTAYEGA